MNRLYYKMLSSIYICSYLKRSHKIFWRKLNLAIHRILLSLVVVVSKHEVHRSAERAPVSLLVAIRRFWELGRAAVADVLELLLVLLSHLAFDVLLFKVLVLLWVQVLIVFPEHCASTLFGESLQEAPKTDEGNTNEEDGEDDNWCTLHQVLHTVVSFVNRHFGLLNVELVSLKGAPFL